MGRTDTPHPRLERPKLSRAFLFPQLQWTGAMMGREGAIRTSNIFSTSELRSSQAPGEPELRLQPF